MTSKMYRGVDVSKAYLDVDEDSKRVSNNAASIREWLKDLPDGVHLICESSGGYERELLKQAWSLGRPITVVMPTRVRAYARSCGQYAKTDRLDCKLLSRFGQERCLPATPPPNVVRTQVRDLLRAREHVLALQLQEQNYREHLPEISLLRSESDQRLVIYTKQISAIEEQIEATIKADSLAHGQVKRLRELKGIGKITAWTVWADLPELGALEPGQSAALCGLAPHADDSGETSRPRHIHHGRATLCRVLYMAAISASRHNTVLRTVYERLRANGKPAKVALIAIARRMIELLNRMLKEPKFSLAS